MQVNKISYKILATLLSVSCILSLFGFVFAEDTQNSDEFLRRQSMLNAFGIWQDAADESREITRAEFVMLMGRIFNIGQSSQRYFTDVESSHKASGIINMAVEKGIVEGYGGGEFRPEDQITSDEATLIVLRSLGYTEQILDLYDNASIRGKIMQDVPRGDITWGGAFQIAENLFEINPLVRVNGGDQNGSLEESEKNVWEFCQDIYKVTGILNQSGKLSTFYSNSENEKIIKVGEETFDNCENNYSEYFGMNVCAYYREDTYDDERTVLYLEPYGQQSKVTVIAQDIVSADKGSIEYEQEDSSKTREIKIASGASVIYNSRYLGDISTEYVQLDMLEPDNGSICAIDNNNDSRAEVLIIEEYDVYKIIQVGDEKIWVDGADPIDIDEDTPIYKNGEKITTGSIFRDDVLQVYRSVTVPGVIEGELSLRISDTQVSGKVQETGTDYIVIDDVKYRVSDGSLLQNLVINSTEVDMFLDSQGIVVFIEMKDNTSIHYGVPILCTWDESGDNFLIKIITDENGVQMYNAAQKITCVNGEGKSSRLERNTFESYFGSGSSTIHKLIGFKLNSDNEISQIIEPADATSEEWGDYDRFSLDAILQTGENGISSISYEANKINAKYYVTGNAKAFVLPEDDSTQTEDYTVLPAGSAISLSRPSYVEIYDLDENMQFSFIVMKSSVDVSKSISFSSTVGVVQSVNEAVNENNDFCYLVELAIGGEIKKYYTESRETQHVESVYSTNTYWNHPGMLVSELEYGDAIQISTNDDGYITAFRLMLDRSESAQSSFAVSSGDWTLGDYIIPGSDLGIYYGPVMKPPTESNFVIKSAGEKLIVPGATPRSLKVYLCDSDKEDIEICEWSEVQEGDYVLVVLDWRFEREIVIYR